MGVLDRADIASHACYMYFVVSSTIPGPLHYEGLNIFI